MPPATVISVSRLGLVLAASAGTTLACSSPTDSGTPGADGRVTVGWESNAELPFRSITVDSGGVYFRNDQGAVVSLDRRTGALRWRQAVAGLGGTTFDIRAVHGRVIVAADVLLALDAADGREVWRRPASDGFGRLHTFALDSLLIPTTYRSTGGAVALDARTGDTRWVAPILPPDSAIAPTDDVRAFAPVGGTREVAFSFNWWRGAGPVAPHGGLALVDAISGQRRWSILLPPPTVGTAVLPTDADASEVGVSVSTRDGLVHFYDRETGQRRWVSGPVELPAGTPRQPDERRVLQWSDLVVAGSGLGVITAYDRGSGSVRWRHETQSGATSALLRGPHGTILTRHLNGDLVLTDGATGRLVWTHLGRRESERVYAAVVAGDSIFGSRPGGVTLWVVQPR